MYADVVATCALIAALASLGWQTYIHVRWNRPVLAVSGDFGYYQEAHSDGSVDEQGWGFTVVASNVGSLPTRLLDAVWELELADGRTVLVRGTDSADGLHQVRTSGETLILDGVVAPATPLTLQTHDAVEWEWTREEQSHPLIATAVRARPVVTYVSRNRGKAREGGNPNTTLGSGEWRPIDPGALKTASARPPR
jgi:hypothetical protein